MQLFFLAGRIFMLGAAWAAGAQDGSIVITSARPQLPPGRVQILSSGLMVPVLHAHLQTSTDPFEPKATDSLGTLEPWPWSPQLRLAWAAEAESTRFESAQEPKVLPENRWAWGRLCTLVIEPAEGAELPKLANIRTAVLTGAGEVWPTSVNEVQAAEGRWIVRMREEDRFLGDDPAAFVLLRIDAEGEAQIWTQIWSLRELRSSMAKPLLSLETGALHVQAKRGAPFGELVQRQTISSIQLAAQSPFAELHNSAALGWLACPDPLHWKLADDGSTTLTGIPIGRVDVQAHLSGSTAVFHRVPIEAAKTSELELFETPGPHENGEPYPPSYAEAWDPLADFPWANQVQSFVWGPLGNLFSQTSYRLPNPTLEPVDPLQEAPTFWVPIESGFGWSRQVQGAQGQTAHSFQAYPRNGPFVAAWTQPDSNEPLRLLQLTDRPSSGWSGTLVLYLFQGHVSSDQTRVVCESFTLGWPLDQGRALETHLELAAPWFWYAVSWEGQGAFGSSHDVDRTSLPGTGLLDPSMEPGWSALLVNRQAATDFGQAASARSLPAGPEANLDPAWRAAGGLTLATLPFPPVTPLGGQMGVCLLSSPGIPQSLHLSISGALDRTLPTPDGTTLFEVRIPALR